jgi:NADPH-dependent curcumin reductase CurA
MTDKNVQLVLANRPKGWVQESDFKLVETDCPKPGEGEVLLKTLYLSVDPYMRNRMDDTKSYSAKVEIGQVMVGGTLSEVVESNNPRFQPGDTVASNAGWQKYVVSDGKELRRVDPELIPLTAYLGTAGMPGVTAWVGLFEIAQLKEGENVVVSAASGAVGSVAGQLAKLKGCRVVGIAGGKDKCDYVVQELGFDECIDYKAPDFYANLKKATPNGVDVYFENVGGPILDAVLRQMNPFGRIPVCGLISEYNATEPYGLKNYRVFLTMRLRVQGFIVSEFPQSWPEALDQLSKWVAEGKLKYRETITEGLENAPKAFIGMLRGENFGKQLVKVS